MDLADDHCKTNIHTHINWSDFKGLNDESKRKWHEEFKSIGGFVRWTTQERINLWLPDSGFVID